VVELDSIIMLAKVMLSFGLLFILLPMLVTPFDRGDDGLGDRLFIPLIHSSVAVIIFVHILAVAKLFESLSLLALSLIVWLYFLRKKAKTASITRSSGTKVLTNLYDLSESWDSLKRIVKSWLLTSKTGLDTWLTGFNLTIRGKWLALTGIAVSLLYAAYVRFHHVLIHYYFGASDAYVHIKWSKFLMKNILYVDGVYSYGFEAIIAGTARFFLIDIYEIVRFIGPIASMLVILSIGYAVVKLGYNLYAAWIAMFVYAVSSYLPADTWRQISALPLEYSVIFFLPGIVFFLLYCKGGKKYHLLLAAECLFLTVMIHPFAALCHGVAYLVVGLLHVGKLITDKRIRLVIGYLGIAGSAGVVPILLPLAFGLKLHGPSAGYVSSTVGSKVESDQVGFWESAAGWLSPLDGAVIALVAISLLAIAIRYGLKRDQLTVPPVSLPTVCVLGALFFIMYRAGDIGLPMLLPKDRLGIIVALLGAFGLGVLVLAAWRVFETGFRRLYLSSTVVLTISASIVIAGYVVEPPKGDRFQYDEAVKAFISIKENFDAVDWTIVSPIEEYPLVEAFGYHTNLWEFVQRNSPESTDPMGFPTSNVFFFVETLPLYPDGKTPITPMDARKPFPGPPEGDISAFYYKNENRITLEAKLMNWVTWYMNEYPDRMMLYMDTPHFKVYHLKQEAQTPALLLPTLPLAEEGNW